MKLLVETSAEIRQPAPDDPFECGWHLTASSALQGLWLTDAAELVVTRARQRCPREARFVLARAIIAEQRARMALRRAGPEVGLATAFATDALRLYDSAMALPDIEHEARVRAAWVRLRTSPERALALLDGVTHPSKDPSVLYLPSSFAAKHCARWGGPTPPPRRIAQRWRPGQARNRRASR